MSKPKLFIGSSREAIKEATAVHRALARVAEVTPWHAGAFKANDYTMEALERQLDASDYAVFIFAADDIAVMRGRTYLAPRDNTVFEMGLFWGKLRKERVFFLIPESIEEERDGFAPEAFRLPSDLMGLTVLTMESRTDGNLDAAVNVACAEIADRIERLGPHEDGRQSIEQLEAAVRHSRSLLQFFIEFNRKAFRGNEDPYERLAEAVRNAYDPWPLDGFRVTGTAIWKAGKDGLSQMAGNNGRNRFFPYNVNDGKKEGQSRVLVVDAYLNSTMRFLRLSKPVATSYLLCYPVGKEYVITVHLGGLQPADHSSLQLLEQHNAELMDTVNYLLGGESI